jgi:hypothetical protein
MLTGGNNDNTNLSRCGANKFFPGIMSHLAMENSQDLKTLGDNNSLTLDVVFEIAKKTLDLLLLYVDRVPYGVRWIFKQMRSLLRVIICF